MTVPGNGVSNNGPVPGSTKQWQAEAASEEWLPLTLMTDTSPHVQRRGPFCGNGRLWHVRIEMDTKRDIKITAGERSHP